jgi:hypothetical protein
VLLTGQATGALAAYSVLNKVQPRKASVRSVQQLLLDAKCFLMPYVDVLPTDTVYWQAIQKAGATGILKGTGKSEGWANKTYFYPDSTIAHDNFISDVNRFIPCLPVTDTTIMRPLQVKEAWDMLVRLLHVIRVKRGIPHPWPPIILNEQVKIWTDMMHTAYPGDTAPVKRKELAVLISALAQNPFDEPVGWDGKLPDYKKNK